FAVHGPLVPFDVGHGRGGVRRVDHLVVTDVHTHVMHRALAARFGEEQQITGPQVGDFHIRTGRGLVQGIPWDGDAVRTVDRVGEPGAVVPEGGHTRPQVTQPQELLTRSHQVLPVRSAWPFTVGVDVGVVAVQPRPRTVGPGPVPRRLPGITAAQRGVRT